MPVVDSRQPVEDSTIGDDVVSRQPVHLISIRVEDPSQLSRASEIRPRVAAPCVVECPIRALALGRQSIQCHLENIVERCIIRGANPVHRRAEQREVLQQQLPCLHRAGGNGASASSRRRGTDREPILQGNLHKRGIALVLGAETQLGRLVGPYEDRSQPAAAIQSVHDDIAAAGQNTPA